MVAANKISAFFLCHIMQKQICHSVFLRNLFRISDKVLKLLHNQIVSGIHTQEILFLVPGGYRFRHLLLKQDFRL